MTLIYLYGMATYKVIQDIEAEDKLLGPLTLRQFVYAGIALACLWLGYMLVAKGAPVLVILILPFFLVSGFFAVPWSREQPTELWALARVRFLLKPRRRVWDQSGVKELVTITVPKRIERMYSDGLTQTEVKSRLHALAETIDSRGWAIKNSAMNPYAIAGTTNDRLIDPGSLPQETMGMNSDTYEDMLDLSANPKAQAFDSMLAAKAEAQHQRLATMAQAPQMPATSTQQISGQPTDYWFLNQPSQQQIPQGNNVFGSSVVTPGMTNDDATTSTSDASETALAEELRAHTNQQTLENAHLPTLLPLAEQEKRKAAAQLASTTIPTASNNSTNMSTPAVTAAPDAAILELAHNDDLNIETIARQAKKAQTGNDGEVVISLH